MKTTFLIITTATSLLFASCAGPGGTTSSISRPYTKNTCLVTGNKLGSMGTPVSYNHEGQQIKLCCRPCLSKFKADPQRYLSKI